MLPKLRCWLIRSYPQENVANPPSQTQQSQRRASIPARLNNKIGSHQGFGCNPMNTATTMTQAPQPASQVRHLVASARPLRDNDLNSPDISGAETVHEFLKRCHPPMDRYFTAFINFGCTTETHLRSFARFAQEKKYSILKQLLVNQSGVEGFTEMDVAVLENQLETYFFWSKFSGPSTSILVALMWYAHLEGKQTFGNLFGIRMWIYIHLGTAWDSQEK